MGFIRFTANFRAVSTGTGHNDTANRHHVTAYQRRLLAWRPIRRSRAARSGAACSRSGSSRPRYTGGREAVLNDAKRLGGEPCFAEPMITWPEARRLSGSYLPVSRPWASVLLISTLGRMTIERILAQGRDGPETAQHKEAGP
jgi:hypothetical protein